MLIQTIMNIVWQITVLIISLPFNIINEIIDTVRGIISLIIPEKENEEEQAAENSQYHEPVKVKGFHTDEDNKQTEE